MESYLLRLVVCLAQYIRSYLALGYIEWNGMVSCLLVSLLCIYSSVIVTRALVLYCTAVVLYMRVLLLSQYITLHVLQWSFKVLRNIGSYSDNITAK